MAKINKMWTGTRGGPGKGETSLAASGLPTGAATVEISVENSLEAKINLPKGTAMPLLGTHPKDLMSNLVDCCSAMFTDVCSQYLGDGITRNALWSLNEQ